jgi:DNA polymerase elongation subunit (family B)
MRYLKNIDKNNALFIELDTRPLAPYVDLGKDHKDLWTGSAADFESSAGFYPEFSTIKSIAIAKVVDGEVKTYSFAGDEKELLTLFARATENLYAKNPNTVLCGYKLKQFIIPYLIKKCVSLRVDIPLLLDVVGKKPWEVHHVCLYEVWQGIGYYGSKIENVLLSVGLPIPAGVSNPAVRDDPHATEMLRTVINLFQIMRNEDVFDFSVAPGTETEQEIKPAGLLEQLYAQKGTITKEQEARLKELMSTLNTGEKKIADEILKSIKKTRVKK